MGEKTKIEWCDYTFNPWIGCTRVSPGCDNCYAASQNKFRGWVKQWGKPGQPGDYRRTSEANWRKPLQWARNAREDRVMYDEIVRLCPDFGDDSIPPFRPRIFSASLADVFDNQVPTFWRAYLFDLILKTPELDWLLLTKRPENIEKMLPPSWFIFGPLPNVWLGFTAEDQEHFDRRWPIVRDIPAAVRFCSYEPAIGPLRLWKGYDENADGVGGIDYRYVKGLNWLICGGESGPGYRPMNPGWAEDVRLDCARAGVSFFFKQFAGKKPIPVDFPLVRQFPV